MEEIRSILDGFALGNEGLERFELELRLHATTYARWKSCKENEKRLRLIIMSQDTITDQLALQRDLQTTRAEKAERHTKRNGWFVAILAAVVIILALSN